MTGDTERTYWGRRWIVRLLFALAMLFGIAIGAVICLAYGTAVLMGVDALGVRAAWITPVAMLPGSILFYYVAARTGAWSWEILERITGMEDDLTVFLRQISYIETGPEDGYWIDRDGRVYQDEAALMRGARRFSKERAG